MGLWAESRAESLPKTLLLNLRFEVAIWGQGEILSYLPQPFFHSKSTTESCPILIEMDSGEKGAGFHIFRLFVFSKPRLIIV